MRVTLSFGDICLFVIAVAFVAFDLYGFNWLG